LMAFALGLPGMIGAKILITNYYSRKNTLYPVKAALIAVICNFILNIVFVLYLINSEFKGAHVGLALATSISAYINFYFLLRTSIRTKIIIIDASVTKVLVKSIIATIIMTIFILYFDLSLNTWVNLNLSDRLVNLLGIVVTSAAIYFLLLITFKILPKNINS